MGSDTIAMLSNGNSNTLIATGPADKLFRITLSEMPRESDRPDNKLSLGGTLCRLGMCGLIKTGEAITGFPYA